MAHHFQELAKMDLKTLLNESDSFKRMMGAQSRVGQLHEYLGVSGPEELEKILNTASAMYPESAATSTEREARQTLENALGLSGLATHNAQTAADFMRMELKNGMDAAGLTGSDPDAFAERIRTEFGKASGVLDRKDLGDLDGYARIDFDEIDRQAKEQHQQQMLEMSQEHARRMVDDAAEFRRREDAKLEYARRSAEASEEVLAEERRKRGVAELTAQQAKVDKDKAEERAERAERRERRLERLAVLGLVGTVAGLVIAAWSFIKDAMGW